MAQGLLLVNCLTLKNKGVSYSAAQLEISQNWEMGTDPKCNTSTT